MLRSKTLASKVLPNVSSTSLVYTGQQGLQAMLVNYQQYSSVAEFRLALEEKMKAQRQQQDHHHYLQQQPQQKFSEGDKVSIYRVPEKLRHVSVSSYRPHFISMGPYHRGSRTLQAAEAHKWLSFDRLVENHQGNSSILDRLVVELRDMEPEARSYYSEKVELSEDEFVEMMLLDGCFIIQLFRELHTNKFVESCSSPLLSKRWMLPVVRRDLITLENQLPMIVLKKLFDQTKSKTEEGQPSLEELALRFFDPLMPRPEKVLAKSIESMSANTSSEYQFKHLLDLFHSSICLSKPKTKNSSFCPVNQEVKKEKGRQVRRRYYSASELKKTGMKVRVRKDSEPLDLIFDKGVLKMPYLHIDDHTGIFFRNVVAYEQCHPGCQPDMTTYLYFLDKLIDTARDVEILDRKGVIQHALGSNEQVADLVNELCREVEHDGHGSHLACHVVEGINSYANHWWISTKTRLRRDYFTDVWTTLTTLAALLLLYLALVQATCNVVDTVSKERQHDHYAKSGWWGILHVLLVDALHLFLVNRLQEIKNIWPWKTGPKEPSAAPPLLST